MTTTADRFDSRTGTTPLKWAGGALAASFALLYTELFLTADAEAPNTWVGMASDTAILTFAGALAIGLAALARKPGRASMAAVACCALTVLFSLPFWTGSAIVLGVTTYALNAGARRPLALIGAGMAVLTAGFLMVEMVVGFAPGLPS